VGEEGRGAGEGEIGVGRDVSGDAEGDHTG
jgi:hypothetical protein